MLSLELHIAYFFMRPNKRNPILRQLNMALPMFACMCQSELLPGNNYYRRKWFEGGRTDIVGEDYPILFVEKPTH